MNYRDLKPQQLTLILLTANLIIIFSMIVFSMHYGYGPDRYFKEGRFATWVSFFQLLACSLLSFRVFLVRKKLLKDGRKNGSFQVWILMFVGFLYLAGDEIWMGHENIDFFIHRVFDMQETGLSDRIDDLLIGFYGLLGISLLWYFRDEMENYKPWFPLFKLGFALFIITVAVDLAINRDDVLLLVIGDQNSTKKILPWLNVLEESSKMLSEMMFVAALYGCFLSARSLHQLRAVPA